MSKINSKWAPDLNVKHKAIKLKNKIKMKQRRKSSLARVLTLDTKSMIHKRKN